MANKQSLFKKAKNILDTRLNNSWLHNTYVLYFIFIIALGYAYSLMVSSDWYFLSVFVILGFLTSFFSKNIVVILCIALGATNILKYGIKKTMEGFDNEYDNEDKNKDDEKTNSSSNENSTESLTAKSTDVPSNTLSKEVDLIDNKKKHSIVDDETELDVAYENPTEQNRKMKKDGFKQKPDGVYTSIDDMDVTKVYDEKDTILKNQERILKNLNQYKPLLDTINSITKSVSSIKQTKNP
jgi:hypothetical protein